jgi:hypothetical protein
MRRARHVTRMQHMRNAYSILVGKPDRNRPFGRCKYKWEDTNRMDLQDIV